MIELDRHQKYRRLMSKKIKPIKIFPLKEINEKDNKNDSKEQQED